MSIFGARSDKSRETSGLIAGIACFTTWGLIPIYWKLLGAVPATEILAHRFVWTTIFLSILLSWQRRWPELIANVRSRRARIYCLTGGLAIASNWFLFIYAVNIGRVIETSLGYFMTPLMNVLFGALFLRERLTRWQFVSVLLAALGVLNLTFGYGRFPWIAVSLCVTFGLYGLLRKQSGYHEPFTRGHLVTFVFIWLALALFTGEAVFRWRSGRVREIDSCAFEASALD